MTSDHGPSQRVLDLAPPLVVYFGLELLGVPDWFSFSGSVAIVVARLGWLACRGGLTRASLLSAVLFVITAILVTLTGDRWLFLVKGLLGELILGMTILITDKRGKYPWSLSILRRLRPRRGDEFLRMYELDPAARRRYRVVSRAWGIGIIAEGFLRGAALFALPHWLAMMTFALLSVVTFALGPVLTLRYLSLRQDPGISGSTP